MYNLMQLSYFLENSTHLRVRIPSQFNDIESFNVMINTCLKELFIIIPNINGLVIHLSNLKFSSNLKCLDDVLNICDTGEFTIFDESNLYLELNGTQILDNNGLLLFKKDVEKYLATREKNKINECIYETILDIALMLKFCNSNHTTLPNRTFLNETNTSLSNQSTTDISLQHTDHCLDCIDRFVGVQKTTRRKRLDKRMMPFSNRVYG